MARVYDTGKTVVHVNVIRTTDEQQRAANGQFGSGGGSAGKKDIFAEAREQMAGAKKQKVARSMSAAARKRRLNKK